MVSKMIGGPLPPNLWSSPSQTVEILYGPTVVRATRL